MSYVDDFRDAMRGAGITPPDHIEPDSAFHRFDAKTGKPRKDGAGFYKLHGDGIPAGVFGDWAQQLTVRWCSKDRQQMTADERAAHRAFVEQAERERHEAEIAQRAATAERARGMLESARPAEDAAHPYLQRKRLPGLGAFVLGAQLLVPVYQAKGKLAGLQVIPADGDKKFLTGTHAQGGYMTVGQFRRGQTIVICEGWATGASIYLATQFYVVVAFSAGNLIEVANKLRAAMPDARLVIAADDDAFTVRPERHPQAGEPWNPGIEAAAAAALAVGGTYVLPRWAGERGRGTDFNDLHAAEGLEAVRACFDDEIDPRPPADEEPPFHVEQPALDDTSLPEFFDRLADSLPPSTRAALDDDEPAMIFATTPYESALKFLQAHPATLFWRGEWFTWAGHRYAVRDPDYLRQLVYTWAAACTTIKVDPKTGGREVVAFAPNRDKVGNIVDALKGIAYADVSEPPTWLDQQPDDPPAGEIIAFRNGFLHAPTRRLLPSSPRLFVISALDFDYVPDAPQPEHWMRFLSALWGEDPESIDALACMFGYLLTDDTSQQKAFMFVGPPRSGKGTILRVLERLVGAHNRVSPSLASLGTQFGLQPLIGKRVALISDARLSGKTDQQPIVENILRITGEDSLSIDRKNTTHWTGKLNVRFIMATNEVPGFSDASAALANRFVIFKFVRGFLGQEDLGLTVRLLSELPGIVLWALDGLDRLRSQGYLPEPASARDVADELREQASPVSVFVAERCVLAPSATVERVAIFKAWREWCQQQGREHAGTAIGFGRQLGAAFPSITRSQPRAGGTRLNLYLGVRLRDGFDDDEPT